MEKNRLEDEHHQLLSLMRSSLSIQTQSCERAHCQKKNTVCWKKRLHLKKNSTLCVHMCHTNPKEKLLSRLAPEAQAFMNRDQHDKQLKTQKKGLAVILEYKRDKKHRIN